YTFLQGINNDLSTDHMRQVYKSVLVSITPDVVKGNDGVTSTFQPLLSVTAKKYNISIGILRSSAEKRTEFLRDMRQQARPSESTADDVGGFSPSSNINIAHDYAPGATHRPRVFDMRRDNSSRQFHVLHPDTHVLGITVWESNSTAMPHDTVTSHDAAQGMHYLDPHTNKRVCHPDALCQQHAQKSQIGTDEDVYANFKERFEQEGISGPIPCLSTFVKWRLFYISKAT
ncbi:unnamed protein product, partial [Choristocarpus tenellus]